MILMAERLTKRHVVLDVETVLDPSVPVKLGRGARVTGALHFAREAFRNDGAEGETVHLLCDEIERLTSTPEESFAPPVAWQVVSIGCFAFVDFEPEQFGCLRGEDERAKIASYVSYLEKDKPCVVGWNTRHFDNPVIGHRALKYGIPMPWWYGSGKGPRYRYGGDALDLKDVLSDHGASFTGSMDQTSRLIGWPGKTFDGSAVAAMHARGEQVAIDRGCLTDVAQEAAVWLRFELLRGTIKTREWPRIANRMLAFLEKQAAAASLIAEVDRALFIGPNHATQIAFAEE